MCVSVSVCAWPFPHQDLFANLPTHMIHSPRGLLMLAMQC